MTLPALSLLLGRMTPVMVLPVIARLLREASTLRWLQSQGVDVDGLLNEEAIDSDLVLTNLVLTNGVVAAHGARVIESFLDNLERLVRGAWVQGRPLSDLPLTVI